MSDYEQELEQRIEDLQTLWIEDNGSMQDVANFLDDVNKAVEEFRQYIITLQNPASSTNKHSEEVYQMCLEKTNNKVNEIIRKIEATRMGIRIHMNMCYEK